MLLNWLSLEIYLVYLPTQYSDEPSARLSESLCAFIANGNKAYFFVKI
jgi:hypothetical protein